MTYRYISLNSSCTQFDLENISLPNFTYAIIPARKFCYSGFCSVSSTTVVIYFFKKISVSSVNPQMFIGFFQKISIPLQCNIIAEFSSFTPLPTKPFQKYFCYFPWKIVVFNILHVNNLGIPVTFYWVAWVRNFNSWTPRDDFLDIFGIFIVHIS